MTAMCEAAAATWGRCAENYKTLVHEGPKLLDPLFRHVADTIAAAHPDASQTLKVLDIGR